MIKICSINPAAIEKLPPTTPDASGIGAHYVDAFIAPMNTSLEDGTQITCKRKGLKITLTVGTKTGDGLMRREGGRGDPTVMVRSALAEAANAAGVGLKIADAEIFLLP